MTKYNKTLRISANEITENLVLDTSATHLVIVEHFTDLAQVQKLGILLKDNDTITNINLSRSQIEIEGVKAIADALKVNHTITDINLFGNQIGDEGAKAIADALKVNHTITDIDLFGNQIGNEGAKAIADALKVNHSITDINLPFNQIGNEGAKAIADALKVNNTITDIYLFSNQIGNDGEEAIADALKGNKLLVKKLANFLVERFVTEKDFALQDITKYASAFKYYQVADKKLLQQYVEQSISLDKFDNQPMQTISFNHICKNVESFSNSEYFHLAGICKTHNSETNSINFIPLPQELCEHVTSFLGSHSLWAEAAE